MTFVVSDIKKSEKFYDGILPYLGFKKTFAIYGFVGWEKPPLAFFLTELEGTTKQEKHEPKKIGLHHFSFLADSEKNVDEFHAFLKSKKLTSIERPLTTVRDDDKSYYTYFIDPDGMKVEYATHDAI